MDWNCNDIYNWLSVKSSHSSLSEWIEICALSMHLNKYLSHSSLSEWIEIILGLQYNYHTVSLTLHWVSGLKWTDYQLYRYGRCLTLHWVSGLKSNMHLNKYLAWCVSLFIEWVDWNLKITLLKGPKGMSHSSLSEWIEIWNPRLAVRLGRVSLFIEWVDWNRKCYYIQYC